MRDKKKVYGGKILLAGEYTTLQQEVSLLLPLKGLKGHWVFDLVEQKNNKALLDFFHFIERSTFSFAWERETFLEDMAKGLYFESNLPQGYGVGSSGALSAAFYDSYAVKQVQDLSLLKKQLAEIESFFHGTSSGLDPLVSLIGSALLIDRKIQKIELETPSFPLFLWDSGASRQQGTKSLVTQYLKAYQDLSFKEKIEARLRPLVKKLIISYRQVNQESFEAAFVQLSQLQLQLFSFCIPEKVRELWQKGLDSKTFWFKLCGAGGGGFFLCYQKEPSKLLEQTKLVPVYSAVVPAEESLEPS